MSTADEGGVLLRMVLDVLEGSAHSLRNAEPMLCAFAAWLDALDSKGLDIFFSLASAAASKVGASRHYQDIAVLGFAGAKRVGGNFCVEESFLDGLEWMKGRRFFLPNQPSGFEADGIAILGFAVGIAASGDLAFREANKRWLDEIICRSIEHTKSQEWDASLLFAARLILSAANIQEVKAGNLVADLAAALASKGIVQLTEEWERQARLEIVNPGVRCISPDRAAVQSVALRWLMRGAAQVVPNRAKLADVVGLLEGIPHALKRWPWEDKPRTTRAGVLAQRWDLQNEYHVQSLLWAVLAPVFRDLEDEEYLKSIGHKHPRTDLVIPSLGLIIEVKFIRDGNQAEFAGIINEISADTGIYLSNSSELTKIVAFIWDNSRSNDQHAEMLNGLRRLNGIADAVVVSRPGRWEPLPEALGKKNLL